MTLKSKISLGLFLIIMVFYFTLQSLLVFDFIQYSRLISYLGYFSFVLFCIPLYIFVRDFLSERKLVFDKTLEELRHKNTYLEHAAKILRHDMHSGINVYIPRGISSLERRLPKEIIEKYKLENPLKLLKDGLVHTQKVYRGVYEFTNLVKQGKELEFEEYNLRKVLSAYLETTSYKDQVVIDYLPSVKINEPLFCTAIDNLIRNGLKYNDNENKLVVIYMYDDDTMAIQDNGRGLTQEEFEFFSTHNTRRTNQKETGSGLGLGICVAILKEHNFEVSCENPEQGGTIFKIKMR